MLGPATATRCHLFDTVVGRGVRYLNSKDLEKASSTGTATANQVAVPIVNNFFVGGQPWRPSDTPVD